MTTDKSLYEVVDPKVIFCAGKRIPDDRRLALTENEARYELIAGAIRPASEPARKGKAAEPTTEG